jgi:hypothetical protein
MNHVLHRTAPPHLATLEQRIPNPPAVFVGRKQAMRWLKTAIARAPVTAVVGVGGVGKTALAAAALAERVARVENGAAIAVSFDANVPRDPARAVLRAFGIDAVAGSEGELDAIVVDVAEQRGAVVLLDDVHHVEEGRLSRFVGMLARYARRSRWVVTSRRRIECPAIAGQVLPLEPMLEDELVRLARALSGVSPKNDGADEGDARSYGEVARRALGSPWRLKLLLGAPAEHVDVLDALRPAACELAETLAVLGRPIALSRLPEPLRAEVATLVAFRLAEVEDDRAFMHEMTRSLVLEARPEALAERRASARTLLAEQEDPGARMAAIRLAIDDGRRDEAITIATRARDSLVAAGYGQVLWDWLSGSFDEATRLALALDLGGEALRAVQRPAHADPALALAWVKVLYARGDLQETQAAARALADESEGVVAEEARLLEASAAMIRGDEIAYDILSNARFSDVSLEARRLAGVAQFDWGRGRWSDARKRAEALEALTDKLDDDAHVIVLNTLLMLGREDGDYERAFGLMTRFLDERRVRAFHTFRGRGGLALELFCHVERGELEKARAARERLAPLAAIRSPILESLAMALATLAVAEGKWDEARELVADWEHNGRMTAFLGPLWLALRREIAWRTGEDVPPLPDFDLARFTASSVEIVHRIESERALRWGAEASDAPVARDGPVLTTHRARIAALRALLRGDRRESLEHAKAALACARTSSFALLELDARLLVCDMALAAGDKPTWEREVAAARARASQLGVARALAELALHEAALERAPLERLLPLLDAPLAPSTARRAAALLGGRVRLDRVDEAVLGPLSDAFGFTVRRRRSTLAGGATPAAWLDVARATLIARGGAVVTFARDTVVWKLLLVLVTASHDEANADAVSRERGLDKESLCRLVWEYSSYHPARHDNPIKLGIRNLRRKLEEGGASSLVLAATAGGYALRTDVALVEPSGHEAPRLDPR